MKKRARILQFFLLALGMMTGFGCGSGSIENSGFSDDGFSLINPDQKFFGMFYPIGEGDIEPLIIDPEQDRLTVLQDYQNTCTLANDPAQGMLCNYCNRPDPPPECADLSLVDGFGTIRSFHDKGNVVHLNVFWGKDNWADVEADVRTFAERLADELIRARNIPGILITLGPEMNGTWTSFGCEGDPITGQVIEDHGEEFKAVYRNMVQVIRDVANQHGLTRTRIRFVWGPNNWPAPGDHHPCTYDKYWPGWTYTDYVGYSHYSFLWRWDQQAGKVIYYPEGYQSPEQLIQTATNLLSNVGMDLNSPSSYGRVMILQTGMSTCPDELQSQCPQPWPWDRGAWVAELLDRVKTSPYISGLILFHKGWDCGWQCDREIHLNWYRRDLSFMEGFDRVQNEIANQSRYAQNIRFLFPVEVFLPNLQK